MALFYLQGPAFGASNFAVQYAVRLWQTEDGLPQTSVQAVTQTRDGYLWVGTHQGLARFDGVRFVTFNERTVRQMRSSQITSLAEGLDGSLWIATEHGGLNRLKDGKFTHYAETDGLASDSGLRQLYVASDGAVWIATTNGLSRFRDGTFSNFSREKGLSSSFVRWVCEDAEANIWVATAAGVDCLKNDSVVRSLTGADGLKGNKATTVCVDAKSNLWVGVVGGLTCLRDGAIQSYTKEQGLSDNHVLVIFEDRRGTIWVGTQGGLSRWQGDKFITEVSGDGQPFDAINGICEDREGNIWVATKEGLGRLRTKRFTSFTQREGLAHNNVISVYEDRARALWVGTWGGGLHQMRDGVIAPVQTREKIQGWNSPINLILALHEDHRGQLWVGTDFDGGLFRRRGEKFVRYGIRDGLAPSAVRVIYEDSVTNLWVGTSTGLFFFKDGRCNRFGGDEGLAGNVVRVITEDRENHLWIGTDSGLNRLQGERFFNYGTNHGLSSAVVHAIHPDADGTLWIGTRGGGLNRLKNRKFTSYMTKDGLYSNDVFEILEDAFGYLWMSCRAGIFRVNKKDFDLLDNGAIEYLNCYSYGKQDGLVSTECTAVAKPAAMKTQDGRLWFATSKGLVVTDPAENLQGNEMAPPVIIEEIFADRKPLPKKFSFQLPAGSGDLEFRYTALSFQAPERNQFKYKLDGIDSDWVDAGTRRLAFYNNVPPGHYRFHVIACNNDGVWNEKGDFVSVTLDPHFWETTWFHSMGAIVFLGSIGLVIRYVSTRKLKRKLHELERERAIEHERSRIAQDMHDDLGARLTEIMLLSDVAERNTSSEIKPHITRIGKASRDLVQSLDAIVWAVNPRNDSLNNLGVYIYEYLERFLGMSTLRYRLDVPDQLPDKALSSAARHNLFLVVKESLNNIVKHAEATEVWFRLRFENSVLSISIEDNGKGFARDKTSPTGNGLDNMRLRLEKIGGSFSIQSEPGKGTQTKIQFPLHR